MVYENSKNDFLYFLQYLETRKHPQHFPLLENMDFDKVYQFYKSLNKHRELFNLNFVTQQKRGNGISTAIRLMQAYTLYFAEEDKKIEIVNIGNGKENPNTKIKALIDCFAILYSKPKFIESPNKNLLKTEGCTLNNIRELDYTVNNLKNVVEHSDQCDVYFDNTKITNVGKLLGAYDTFDDTTNFLIVNYPVAQDDETGEVTYVMAPVIEELEKNKKNFGTIIF